MLRTALLLAAIQLSPADGAPVPGASTLSSHADSATMYDGAARELDVVVPRIGRVDISIDGRLDEAAWLEAAVLTGFTQYSPIEGSSASENTTVRVIITDDAFLFAIRADDRSGGVRATLTERDGYGRSDDYVRVVLDTFNDQRRAYVFMVNPLGVQADGLWVAGGSGRFGDPIDWSPDFLWQSSGRVDDEGFSAEIRIPIKSLRFPELEVQDWGLQIQRTIRRTGYSQSWAPITSERANRLEQSGSIRGLEGLDQGLFLEINPTLVGSSQSRANEFDRLVRDGAEYEMGLNLTYGLTSNLTLDGTVNPDFSQIEADAGQIAINERFALFLPEQRPFFLEGTDVFSMPKRLVYTRSIVNPIGAAKLSGKVGSFNVAYLGAVDKLDGGASQPIVNLLRFKHDLGRSSNIGGVYTDRTEPGVGYNRVLGADARLVLGGRYTLEMLAAGSADGRPGSSTDWGSLVSLSARRSGRALSMNASFEDVTADFQAGSGFIRRTGITQVDGRTNYTFRGDRGSLVESWGPSVDASATWDQGRFWSAGTPLETQAGVGLSTSLRGNVGGFLNYRQSSYAFDATYYDGLYSGPSEGDLVPVSSNQDLFSNLHSLSLRGWVSTWDAVRISFGAGWSESPIFSRSVPLGLGERWSTDVGFTVYPTGSIQAEIGARHVTILRSLDESKYSSATIPRLQIRYQLSRALYVRSIGEYSTQSRGDLLDPVTGEAVYSCNGGTCAVRRGSDAHDFRIEGLLAYEPTPGTVLFFGYTRQFEDTSAFTFERVRSVADGLFLKLSYRFRK